MERGESTCISIHWWNRQNDNNTLLDKNFFQASQNQHKFEIMNQEFLNNDDELDMVLQY